MTLENTVEKAVSLQDPCKTALGKSHMLISVHYRREGGELSVIDFD